MVSRVVRPDRFMFLTRFLLCSLNKQKSKVTEPNLSDEAAGRAFSPARSFVSSVDILTLVLW